MLYQAPRGAGIEQALGLNFSKPADRHCRGSQLAHPLGPDIDFDHAAIPALLAVAGLHHHLIAPARAPGVSLIVESGEPREVHHFAALIATRGGHQSLPGLRNPRQMI